MPYNIVILTQVFHLDPLPCLPRVQKLTATLQVADANLYHVKAVGGLHPSQVICLVSNNPDLV